MHPSVEAILYHSPIDYTKTMGETGLPRLLVRELGMPAASGQPQMGLESRPPTPEMKGYPYLYYGVNNNSKKPSYVASNRLIIERREMVQPHYTVLLSPFRTAKNCRPRPGTAIVPH